MADTYFLLSQADRDVLRRLLDDDRNKVRNPRLRGDPVGGDGWQTPEVYVARVPAAGIPALAEAAGTSLADTPGSAVCDLYRVKRTAVAGTAPDDYELTQLTLTRPVLNLSLTAVPGDTWVLAVRDKWGSWFAVTAGGGTGITEIDSLQAEAGTTGPTVTFTSESPGFIDITLTDSTFTFTVATDYTVVINNTFHAANAAADTDVCSATALSDGAYRVGGYIAITAVGTGFVLQLKVDWTDHNNNAQTKTFFLEGLASADLTATGFFPFPPVHIRAKSGTLIKLYTTLTAGIGSIAYDVGGTIERMDHT